MSAAAILSNRPQAAVIYRDAWEARCECGWFGEVYRQHADAVTEAENHVRKAHPRPLKKGSS